MSGPILAVDIGAHGDAALLDVVDLPTLDSGPACRPEISPHLGKPITGFLAPRWPELSLRFRLVVPRANCRA